LAANGLRYNRFHTTALCSPTRAALLTGRNHHSVGTGVIMEMATGYPGYSGIVPASAVGLPEILRLNGYATGCFGKWHNTPATEVSAAGPFERWPTGSTWGCDTFYGFMAGETDQYYPVLYRNTSPINPPRTPEQGYSFSEDMAGETIAWINNVGATNPNKPWFVYLATPGVHEPHQAPKEYRDKYKGRFDAGWDRYREDTLARQKRLGVVPADAKLTPRPKEVPAWDEQSADARKVHARMMETYAAYLEYTDAQIGRVIDAIAAHRVTHLFLPPTALYGLLAHPDVRKGDYSSLLYFTYGAAPTSTAKIREAVEVFGPCMQTLFGQVEAPASCTCLPPWELVENGVLREDRLASCGRRMLLTQVEIMDDDGCLLPAGQPGEIVVQGNLVMRGYYKNEAATAEVSVNGWHHTGDIGYFNDEGYLFIVDRKKDMIISGGFNIYPSEIEQVLSAHPDVHQCAVIGIPDDKWGEAVHAVVQLKPGARADAGELIAAMKDRLGSVKAPKGIDFVDDLPRTGAGKISKKDLRARYWEGVGRNI